MGAEPTINSKYTAEFVGTFLLVLTVGCNVLSGNAVWGGVSIASVLMVSIFALGNISGANFNPAVSVALALSKASGGPGLDWKTASMYCGVQIFAGMIAGLVYSELFWDTFNLAPNKGYSWLQAGTVETLYTFMLCFVVLNVAAAKGNTPNSFYGLAIGNVIVAGAYGAGVVSGGCFNPAVAFGIDSASILLGFGWCLVYAAFEFLGAVLAVAAFRMVRPTEFQKEESKSAPLVSEFLGTFMLVLTVGLNVLGESPAGAYSIAAALAAMIYSLGDVSGANFNPAVTLAIVGSGRCRESMPPVKAGAYVLVQLCGGVAAAIVYSMIHAGHSFPLAPGAKHGWVDAFMAELLFTFVLTYVVLAVAVSTKTKADVMFGLAIGACVAVGGNAIGKISGGSLNPAVSFGIASANMSKNGAGTLAAATVYSIAELGGGLAASCVFRATHSVEVPEEKPLVTAA